MSVREKTVLQVKESAEKVLARFDKWYEWYKVQDNKTLGLLYNNYIHVRNQVTTILAVANDCIEHHPEQKYLYLNPHQDLLLFRFTFKMYEDELMVGEI